MVLDQATAGLFWASRCYYPFPIERDFGVSFDHHSRCGRLHYPGALG
jgi:hypothetical protein